MFNFLKVYLVGLFIFILSGCGLIPNLDDIVPDPGNGQMSLTASSTYLQPKGSSETLMVNISNEIAVLNGIVTVSFTYSNKSALDNPPSSCAVDIVNGSGMCSIELVPGDQSASTIITASANNIQSESISVLVAGTTYAYISDLNSGYVYRCQVLGESGVLDLTTNNCSTNGSTSGLPGNIGASPIVPNQISIHRGAGNFSKRYAYVPTHNLSTGYGDLYVCNIDQNYNLSGCIVSNGGLTESTFAANAITFHVESTNTYAYAVSSSNDKLFKCGLVSTTGALESCAIAYSGAVLESPAAVKVINTSNDAGGIDSVLYVLSDVDVGNNMYKCPLGESGQISSCKSIAGFSFPGANSMVVANNNESNPVFYISANSNTGSGLQYCPISNEDGQSGFGTCVTTPAQLAPVWSPQISAVGYYKIANTYGYLYVSTGTSLWKCNAYGSGFALTNCVQQNTGNLNLDPVGVTFYDTSS